MVMVASVRSQASLFGIGGEQMFVQCRIGSEQRFERCRIGGEQRFERCRIGCEQRFERCIIGSEQRFERCIIGCEQRFQQGRIFRQVLRFIPCQYVPPFMHLPLTLCSLSDWQRRSTKHFSLQMGQLQFVWRAVVQYMPHGREMAFQRLLTDIPLSLREFTYFIVCLLGLLHKTSYCFIPVSKY
jgi:hypothetical protein